MRPGDLCFDYQCQRPSVDAYLMPDGRVLGCCAKHNRRFEGSTPVSGGVKLADAEWVASWLERSEDFRRTVPQAEVLGYVRAHCQVPFRPALECWWQGRCDELGRTAVFCWDSAVGPSQVRWRSHVDELVRAHPDEARRIARVGADLLVGLSDRIPRLDPMDGSELQSGQSGFKVDAGLALDAVRAVMSMEHDLRDEGWVSVLVVGDL